MSKIFNDRKFKIIGLFVLSRIVFYLIIVLMAGSLRELCTYCDNEYYILISKNGYVNSMQTAFFPLVPILIKYVGVNGVLFVNQLAFLGSMLLIDELTNEKELFIVEFLAFSPIGFFSMMLYTESLLVFFTLLSYYLFVKKRFGYGLGIILGLGVAVKSIGAMMFFAVFFGMCYLLIKGKTDIKAIVKTYIPAAVISCLYPAYLQVKFNNWKIFVDCQYENWCRMKTNLFEELIIQFKVILGSNKDVLLRYKLNEIITLIIVLYIILGLCTYLTMSKDNKCDMEKIIVVGLYTIFSFVAINSTIRIPYNNAPTTSFYRYYYSLFPIYIFAGNLKGKMKQFVYYTSIIITFVTAVFFACNSYFY